MNALLRKEIEDWIVLYESGMPSHTDGIMSAYDIFNELLGRKRPEQKVASPLFESDAPTCVERDRVKESAKVIFNLTSDGKYSQGAISFVDKFNLSDLKTRLTSQECTLTLLENGNYFVLPKELITIMEDKKQ